jgi:hypothetical protein
MGTVRMLTADEVKALHDDAIETSREMKLILSRRSWYCEPCAIEVYQPRCPHCGKTHREKR